MFGGKKKIIKCFNRTFFLSTEEGDLSNLTKEEYIETINIGGNSIDLGFDDYGQQYFIEWEDSNGKHEMGLGSYNSNYMLDILYMFDPNYKHMARNLPNEEDKN